MQSWSCDLASPGGDLNISQTMNIWSKCLGVEGEGVQKSERKWDRFPCPSARMPST